MSGKRGHTLLRGQDDGTPTGLGAQEECSRLFSAAGEVISPGRSIWGLKHTGI